MKTLIEHHDLATWLSEVPQWKLEAKGIKRLFQFSDFKEAIQFVHKVAEIAEEHNHHPDIDIRWNKVFLSLTTHDRGGLTERDFEVARRIDAVEG